MSVESVRKTPDGNLLVSGFPFMSFVSKEERSELIDDVDAEYLTAAIKLFESNKVKGKLPRFTLGHNKKDFEAPVIGRVVNMRFDGKDVFGDFLITEPKAQEMFMRGELPALSAEFVSSKKLPLIFAVASTKGKLAHFDIGRPDFIPNEFRDMLVKFEAGDLMTTTSDPVNLNLAGVIQPEPELEGKLDVVVVNQQELADRLKNIETALAEIGKKPAEEAPVEDPTKDPEALEEDKEGFPGEEKPGEEAPEEESKFPAKEPGEEPEPEEKEEEEMPKEEKEDFEAKLARKDAELEGLTRLSKDGCPLNAEEIRAKFAETETMEGLKLTIEHLAAMPKGVDVSDDDEIDTDATAPNVDPVVAMLSARDEHIVATGCSRAEAMSYLAKKNPELFEAVTPKESE